MPHRDSLEAAAAAALAGLRLASGALAARAARWPEGARAVVAGVVIETVPGAEPRIAARLLHEPALELRGGDGDRRIAAVFSGAPGALEALAARLVLDPEIVGLFTAYVAPARDPAAGAGA